MTKEELIKRFEKETGAKAIVDIPVPSYSGGFEGEFETGYSDELFNYLFDTVIADLQQENEHLEYGIERYQWWCKHDETKLNEARVGHLTEVLEKESLQEKYDKLKEENANLGATNETAALTGWICPSCDNSNHPFVTICSCGDAKK